MDQALIAQYCLITAANLAVLGYLIWRYSVFSAEGFGLSFVALSFVSDTIGLLCLAAWEPGALRLGAQEFEMRLFPGVVQLFGLISLGLGLQLVNPRAPSVRRTLTDALRKQLILAGIAISMCGFALFGVGLRLIGAGNLSSFYADIDQFRSEQLDFGGFWYRGVDIALFGMVLILVATKRRLTKVLLLCAILLTPLLLTSNKGGLDKSLMYIVFLMFVFDYPFFRKLAKARILVLVLLILVVAIGFKNSLLSSSRKQTVSHAESRSTVGALSSSGLASIGGRYSNEGLYRGYCTMVSYMRDGLASYYDGRILTYTLDSWVPRLLAPDKEDNPFRAIGYMVNPDGHTYRREVSAPTLVGYAYGDYGLRSTIAYLFVGGVLIGLLRRWAASNTHLFPITAYVFFAILGGVSAEGGFIGTIYTLIMAITVCLPVALMDCLYATILYPHLPGRRRPAPQIAQEPA